ncbi:MAG: peroxiredoxin [Pseudomonadota bacterium]
MSISVGDTLPEATFLTPGADGPSKLDSKELFSGKTVALFAVPGAFTPTCHAQHVPGFLSHADELAAKGVDTIACLAVNDPFVVEQWKQASDPSGKITFLADGSAEFTKAIGMDIDLGPHGLGTRSKRYAMLVKDGKVEVLNVEDVPSTADQSSAAELLKSMG